MNVLVGNADTVEIDVPDSELLATLDDRGAEASGEGAFFDGDDLRARLAESLNQLVVERFDEAGVDDGDVDAVPGQSLRGPKCRPDLGADGEDRGGFAFAHHLALADGKRLDLRVERHTEAVAARGAQRGRMASPERGPDPLTGPVFILRRPADPF